MPGEVVRCRITRDCPFPALNPFSIRKNETRPVAASHRSRISLRRFATRMGKRVDLLVLAGETGGRRRAQSWSPNSRRRAASRRATSGSPRHVSTVTQPDERQPAGFLAARVRRARRGASSIDGTAAVVHEGTAVGRRRLLTGPRFGHIVRASSGWRGAPRADIRGEADMLKRHLLCAGAAVVGLAVLLAAWPGTRPSAQQASLVTVPIDNDDIGGVVTSKNGPEAGVWVIARDDRPGHQIRQDRGHGRSRALRDPRSSAGHLQRVGARLRARRFAEGQERARPDREPERGGGAECGGRGGILSRHLLVRHAQIPDKSLFPGTGPEGNGMAVAFKSQEQWLNAVQLNGCGNCHQLGDKATREMPAALDVSKSSSVETSTRRLQSGPGGSTMVRTIGTMNTERRGTRAPPGGVDRSHPRRRAARVGAAAAARRGAQRRRDRVRLALAQVLHPRYDRHRPAEAHGQCLRPDLRRRRAEHGPPADPGPRQGGQDHHEGADPRSGRPQLGAGNPVVAPLAVLRPGTSVGLAGECTQPDDGSGRTRLLHGANPLAQESAGVLRGGVGPSVGEGVPAHGEPRTGSSRTPARSPCTTRRPGNSRSSTRASARTT